MHWQLISPQITISMLTKWARFQASRQKTMLKRRKIAMKKRPVSNKQLKEQAKHMNYSLSYKMLQIRKQLDRRTNPNRHINELMEELFYPDIAYMNQETLHTSLQLEKQEQQAEQSQCEHQIIRKIHELVLAEDLLDLHQSIKEIQRSIEQEGVGMDEALKSEEHYEALMGHEYYEALIGQLSYYFRNRGKIRSRLERDWEYRMNKMQNKDKNFKRKSCPYLFYDHEDVYLARPWVDLVSDLAHFISQGKGDSAKIDVQGMLREINICNLLYDSLKSLPAQIYEVMLAKILKFWQQSSVKSILDSLTLKQKMLIVYFINLHKQLRYPQHTIIELAQQHEDSLLGLQGLNQSLCVGIVRDPDCTSYHLAIVMRACQLESLQFEGEFEQLSKKLVIKQMSQLPYEKMIDYFAIYLKQAKQYDINFIQLIKFDIFRKTTSAVSKKHLLICLSMIHNGTLHYNQNAIANHIKPIVAVDLFVKTAQTISLRYCSKDLLTAPQLISIIQSYLGNNIQNPTLLQLIANQLVRNKEKLGLQDLSQYGLIINLLGHRSPILAQVIFQAFCDRYKKQYVEFAQKQKYLLANNDKTSEEQNGNQEANPQIIRLEESLVMCIWMLITTLKQHNQSQLQQGKLQSVIRVPTDHLLKIYPLKVQSSQLLISELCLNIFESVKNHGMLWPIKTFKAAQPSNTLIKYYIINKTKNPVVNAMHAQAQQSKLFIHNYNTHTNKYVKQNWSAVNIYDEQAYCEWVWASRHEPSQPNYFSSERSVSDTVLELRKQVAELMDKKMGREGNQEKISSSQLYEYYKLD